MFSSARMSPPLPNHPQTSYSGKRKHRLRDPGSPERNVLTAGPYPQPSKSLIYNPTQETTGKQQEVIFKEPVATGSECRGSKHVPIKVRQLQKHHKGTARPSERSTGWGGGGWGRGPRRRRRKERGKHQTGSSCPVEHKTRQFCVAQQGERRERRHKQTALPELAFLSASQSCGPTGEMARENPRLRKEKHSHER